MKIQSYDLIGDIHGHYDKLNALLQHLGYEARGLGFRHPDSRKVLFLGDYVDRGPKVREVLQTVRSMVDAGDALAIVGNHELGVIQGHTPNGQGGMLKADWATNDKGHWPTLQAFASHADEWLDWIAWMKRLPLFMELDGLRAVHACWDNRRVQALREMQASLADDVFLLRCSTKGTIEHELIETILKGPELRLPPGIKHPDKEGRMRTRIRTCWWNIPSHAHIGELAMPDPLPYLGEVPGEALQQLPNYGVYEKPVFVGHYWLDAHRPKAPLARNIACLDYSAARAAHPLVAYRWDGERELSAAKFTSVPSETARVL